MLRAIPFLLLLAGPAAGQALSTPSTAADTVRATATPPARFAATDTVQAIHRLYARHRRLGGILTAGAVAADIALAGISAANENAGSSRGSSGYGSLSSGPLLQFGFGGYAVIYGIVAAPIMAIGIQQLIAYGPKHEAKAVAEFEATHQIPRKINRRLQRNLKNLR